ncbi:hypothetical protein [Falsiroseomonas sp. CW058]
MRAIIPSHPLALSAGAAPRLVLAGFVLAALWAAVAWAISA